jgi:hypothetical protein
MALEAAIATVDAAIAAIPERGLANGVPFANSAMPSTSHVREHLKWPINLDGTPRPLVDHICQYAKVNESSVDRAKVTTKADIETAVIVAVARLSAQRYYGWTRASFNANETIIFPAATPASVIHADHAVEVARALTEWAGVATRYMGLVYYVSISYETHNHHHLPAATKKLASTTIALSGLKDWIAGNADREGSVFHDMFHCLSDTVKSNAARQVLAREHLSGLKFDNLRKRIPVKAPDSGVAINYAVLFAKASAYRHAPEHLPTAIAPPANLADAVAMYEAAGTPDALTVAVARLRRLSDALAEPSAYLAGFILGCECRATEDIDLDLRTAARTTTILGSPAYARAAGEYSGTFAAGKENGYKAVSAAVPDQVLPRCVAAVVSAMAI